MDAIYNIIRKMNEQAIKERTAFEKSERERIDQCFEMAQEQIISDYEKQKREQIEAIEKNYCQTRNRQQVEIRQSILKDKQYLLHQLFEDAVETLENLPEMQQLVLMKGMLEQLSLKGIAQIIVGEKSANFLTSDIIFEWNQLLSFQLEKSEFIFPKKAGFLIDDQGVQYNFFFSDLIQELQKTMRFEIAKQLFE